MWFFWIALVALVALGLFFWVASKGVPRRDTDLKVAFEGLLTCPSTHPFLLIRKLLGRRFLQFCRYRNEDGLSGVRLVFPIREWSQNYERKLVDSLRDNDFQYQVAEEPDGNFITVDFGDDLDAAERCSKLILRDVFEFPEDAVYRVHLEP